MIQVNVLESGMVRPAADTPRRRLWLSDLDLIQGEYCHVPLTYFYCRRTMDGSPDFFDMAHRLKGSLSKVLVHFYPAAGRLARDGSNRFEIDCNGEGALFVVAQADDSTIVAEFGNFSPSKKLMRLVPQVDRFSTTQDMVPSFPLFLAQVTHFKCGGVCLGIALHHFLADGTAAAHMVNSWAELCRGLDHISLEPFIDRDLLHSREPPTPSFPLTREYPPAPLTSWPGSKVSRDQTSDTLPLEPVIELLEISPDQVNRLKASAPGYTTFEVLAAHIWRCTCMARRIPAHKESSIRIPVNGRARLRPPLPPGFFGNPLFRAMATATVGELTSNGALSYAAGMIHAGVERVDDEYMRSAVDYLAMQPDMERLRGPHLTKGADVRVTSWAGLGLEGANFGWGQPIFVGRGWVEAEGQSYLVPNLGKDKGDYLLSISLQPDHMSRFQHLFFHLPKLVPQRTRL